MIKTRNIHALNIIIIRYLCSICDPNAIEEEEEYYLKYFCLFNGYYNNSKYFWFSSGLESVWSRIVRELTMPSKMSKSFCKESITQSLCSYLPLCIIVFFFQYWKPQIRSTFSMVTTRSQRVDNMRVLAQFSTTVASMVSRTELFMVRNTKCSRFIPFGLN